MNSPNRSRDGKRKATFSSDDDLVSAKKPKREHWELVSSNQKESLPSGDPKTYVDSECGPTLNTSSIENCHLDEKKLSIQLLLANPNLAIPSEAECHPKGPEANEVQVPVNSQQGQGQQGFPNLGNTCYMNASIQCLLAIPTFTDDLLNQGIPWEKLPLDALVLCLTQLLAFKDLCDVQIKEELLENIKKSVSCVAEIFSGNMQNDAHEFLSQCLTQVKEDMETLNSLLRTERDAGEGTQCPPIPSAHPPTKAFKCPVVDNFELELQCSITCKACGHVICKTELSNYLSVQPSQDGHPHPSSVQGALDLFFTPEELAHNCGKCKSHRCSSIYKFSRLPRVLIVHLQRSALTVSGQVVKDTSTVTIPKYLTLSHYCTGHTKSPLPVDSFAHGDDCPALPGTEDRTSVTNNSLVPPVTLTSASEGSPVPCMPSDKDSEPQQCQTLPESFRLQEQKTDPGSAYTQNVAEFPTISPNDDLASEGELPGSASGSCFSLGDIFRWEDTFPSVTCGRGVSGQVAGLEEAKVDPGNTALSSEYVSENKDNGIPGASQGLIGNATGGDSSHTYRLISVVSHTGKSPNSGHYVSDVYDFMKEGWFHFDDLQVWQIPEEEIRSYREQDGYIFFYMWDDIFKLLSRKTDPSHSLDSQLLEMLLQEVQAEIDSS